MKRIQNFFALLRERMWIVPILISCLAFTLALALVRFGAPLLEATGVARKSGGCSAATRAPHADFCRACYRAS